MCSVYHIAMPVAISELVASSGPGRFTMLTVRRQCTLHMDHSFHSGYDDIRLRPPVNWRLSAAYHHKIAANVNAIRFDCIFRMRGAYMYVNCKTYCTHSEVADDPLFNF